MRRYLTGLLAALLLLCTTAGAVDGAGKAEPLDLSASSVADGASNVGVETSIKLDFTKNVVNLLVKDNNMTCFSVTDSKGNQVSIVVSMGDDQVDRDVRNTIYVSPDQKWPAGETLTLTISGNLMAKNGNSMGTSRTLRFTTAGGAAATTPAAAVTAAPKPTATPKPAVKPTAAPVSPSTPTPAPTPTTTPVPTQSPPQPSETPAAESTPASLETETPTPSEPPIQPDSGGSSPIAIILAVVVIVAVAVLVLVLRGRKGRK